MDLPDETVIPLSRMKMVLLLLGCILFIAAGAVLYRLDDGFILRQHRYNDPELVHFFGLAGVVLGVLGLCAGLWKSFDRKPGLVFNTDGLIDNSSAFGAGLVPWSDITGAQIYQFRRTRILQIKVSNPEHYLARGGMIRRALARSGYRMTGCAVSISPTTLKIKFDALLALFYAYWTRYGTASDEQPGQPVPGSSEPP